MTDDIQGAVEQAQAKGTFNLNDVLQGRGYPEDEVTVYTNVPAAYELQALNARLEEIAQAAEQDQETYNALDSLAQALKQEILDSQLTFHLRGISPGHIKKIMRSVNRMVRKGELEEDEMVDYLDAAYIAPHIIKTVNAKGEVDERLFTVEDVQKIQEFLDDGQLLKINNAVRNLSFTAALFDAATDAGFLPKS